MDYLDVLRSAAISCVRSTLDCNALIRGYNIPASIAFILGNRSRRRLLVSSLPICDAASYQKHNKRNSTTNPLHQRLISLCKTRYDGSCEECNKTSYCHNSGSVHGGFQLLPQKKLDALRTLKKLGKFSFWIRLPTASHENRVDALFFSIFF